MNDVWRASFGGKRTLNASMALESRSVNQPSLKQLDPVCHKALRKVIFQPRHHKCSLAESQFVFSKRYGMVHSRDFTVYTREYATEQLRRRRMREGSVDEQHLELEDSTRYLSNILGSMRQQSPIPEHHFQTLFKYQGGLKDNSSNKHCFFITDEKPFLNPQPHDFRPVCYLLTSHAYYL